jgi:hypothetical protein
VLLSRPETLQALQALALVGIGRESVRLAKRDVPVTEFANAISEMASQVVDEAQSAERQDLSEQVLDEYGYPRGDIANPVERAALLASDLAAVSASEAVALEEVYGETITPDDGFEQSGPLRSYEAALMGWRHDGR